MHLKISIIYFITIFHKILSNSNAKLPENVRPESYFLKFRVDLEADRYEGFVEIVVKCYEATSVITLHAQDIEIKKDLTSVKRSRDAHGNIEVDDISIKSNEHFLTIHLKEALTEGQEYDLHIEFGCAIRNMTFGFYGMVFPDKNGAIHKIASTHFEPIYARAAFPCFDEPAMKASFKFIIGRHKRLTVLNNMPLVKSEKMEEHEDWFWDHFEKSVRMSTYLVAFAVLDNGMAKIPAGKINIWIRNDLAGHIGWVRETSSKLMSFHETYLGVGYELPKMDFLAVPLYPAFAGATEMWGLIIYNEIQLVDEKSAFETVPHEIAHQWFGNLVTMTCFGNLWLKEGTTSYMQMISRNLLRQTMDFDIAQNFLFVMETFIGHSLNEICPWYVNDVFRMYSQISYRRGALTIRMIEKFLGLENLKVTWKKLFEKFKYKNFDQNDFWKLFEETVITNNFPNDLSFHTVMESWTSQAGLPVVEVIRDYNKNTATLSQKEYFVSSKKPKSQCWWIPISYATKSKLDTKNTVPKTWMTCPKKAVEISDLKSTDWLLLNIQASGLYAVKYDDKNWKLLSDTLNNKATYNLIPSLNRFQLVLDAYHFVLFGQFQHEKLLDMLSYLGHETDYPAWAAAELYFNQLLCLQDRELLHLMDSYLNPLLIPHYYQMNFTLDETSWVKKEFQLTITRLACKNNLDDCVDHAINHLPKLLKDLNYPLAPELKAIVLCTALQRDIGDKTFILTKILPMLPLAITNEIGKCLLPRDFIIGGMKAIPSNNSRSQTQSQEVQTVQVHPPEQQKFVQSLAGPALISLNPCSFLLDGFKQFSTIIEQEGYYLEFHEDFSVKLKLREQFKRASKDIKVALEKIVQQRCALMNQAPKKSESHCNFNENYVWSIIMFQFCILVLRK